MNVCLSHSGIETVNISSHFLQHMIASDSVIYSDIAYYNPIILDSDSDSVESGIWGFGE